MDYIDTIQRYVSAEKRAGFSGDWMLAQRIAAHVRRVCEMWNYLRNPY